MAVYRRPDAETGLNLFRSALGDSPQEQAASYAADGRANAALCRVHARYLRALVKFDIDSGPGVSRDLEFASKRGEELVDERLGKPHEDYPGGGVHPVFVEEFAGFLEQTAGLLDEWADKNRDKL